MTPLRLALVLPVGLLTTVVPRTARSDAPDGPAGATRANAYSAYEREAIDEAIRNERTAVEPDPEGKVLEGIDIVTLDVFEPRDPVPSVTGFLDVFHTTSKRYVIAREVLLGAGEPYRQSLVDDTVRNLRGLPQLSLVLAVPTRGREPGGVRLLVITKDVWSLRPNWNFQFTNGGIALLTAQPAETNVAGTHSVANLNFVLNPAQVVVGAGYTNYRLDGTRILIQPSANLSFSRSTGDLEGTYGGLVAGQPLFSPRTAWAWDASVTWVDYVYRRFENAAVAVYADPATHETLPFAYRGRLYGTQYTATRSFGWATKHDVTLGASVVRSQYTVDPPSASGASAAPSQATVSDFSRAYVPVSDNRVGPFAQYHTYRKEYVRLLDFETLGLQEDYRLGHEAFVNVYPVARALGSSRDVLGVDAALLYTVPLADGLARATVESITEAQASALSDASIEPDLHVVSPTLLFGRFVFDAHLLYRYRNYLNQTSYLGGDNRMRGYPTQFFAGKDVVSSNLEFRTRSIDVFTAQAGLVAFYDVGDAFNGFANLHPYESVGVGGRVLFPQLDRLVMRLDVGMPVGDGARLPGMTPVSFFFALGQAFGVPAVGPGGGPGSPQLTGSPTTALAPPP